MKNENLFAAATLLFLERLGLRWPARVRGPGRTACGGRLLLSVSGKWPDAVLAFLWAFLPFLFFLAVCSLICLVFWNLSFLFIFFFLPFFPLILIILPLGPSCFLSFFSSLLLIFSPPPLHPRLPLFSPWFLSPSLSLTLFSFYLLLPPLTFLSFVFSFFLPSSFSVFSSRLVLYIFFPVFSLLFPFLLFSTPFPGPLNFPLFFSARGLPTAPRGRSLPLAGRPRRALLERRRQPEPASGENGQARLGMTGDPGPSP